MWTNTSGLLRNVPEAQAGIDAYMGFYNEERPYQALGNRTPREVFEAGSVNTKVNAPENQEGGWIANEPVASLPDVGTPQETRDSIQLLAPSLSAWRGPSQHPDHRWQLGGLLLWYSVRDLRMRPPPLVLSCLSPRIQAWGFRPSLCVHHSAHKPP